MIDLAIVGAGAAGIAAARSARERGLTFVLLEASNRIGGRAFTSDWQNCALDLGATWMHSADRNPLAAIAEQLGVAIDRAPTPWRNQFGDLGYSKEEQVQSWTEAEAFAERLRKGVADDRASNALEPGNEWNGFIEALNGFLNGTSLANTSAKDFIAYWDASDSSNWRLPRGYGALLSRVAEGLDVQAGQTVGRVDWTGGTVRLTVTDGVVECGHAILAVPTNVLASGDIIFSPGVDDHLHAASQLPLGRVEKLFLTCSKPDSIPANAHLIGTPRSAETGSYMLRPLAMPVIEAFFGGDWLDTVDGEDLAAIAREELATLLGSDFSRRLSRIAYSDWKNRPFIRGSYSYARPGGHRARSVLCAPVDGPIAFAGEACSESDYATVHGAWASGRTAFQQLFGAAA